MQRIGLVSVAAMGLAACGPVEADPTEMEFVGQVDEAETIMNEIEPSSLNLALFPCEEGSGWCGELGFSGLVKIVGQEINGPLSMEVADLQVTDAGVSYEAAVETEIGDITVKIEGVFDGEDLDVEANAILVKVPVRVGSIRMERVQSIDEIELVESDTGE